MAVGDARDVQKAQDTLHVPDQQGAAAQLADTGHDTAAGRPGARARHAVGFWSRLLGQSAAVVGALVMLALIALALGADIIAPHDPFATSTDALLAPSPAHPFGTDDLGRDVFNRVVHGARVSLLVGLVSAFTATLLGVLVVGVGGFVGGLVDDVLMRVTEVFMVVPRFFLALVVVSLMGGEYLAHRTGTGPDDVARHGPTLTLPGAVAALAGLCASSPHYRRK